MKKHFKIYAISLILAVLTTGIFAQEIVVPLRFDRYYTYEEVNEALKLLNKTYPDLTKLELVGKSDEGRDIWSITVNNPKTGQEDEKPAIYVDGNIHGNEIQATEVALYFLDYVLKNYGRNIKITEMVDRITIYSIPSVNVDGRVHFMNETKEQAQLVVCGFPRMMTGMAFLMRTLRMI